MTINKRKLALAVSCGTLLLTGLTGCVTNRDGYQYDTWTTAASTEDGILLESLRKPWVKSGMLTKEHYGTRLILYRIRHTGDEPRCVKVSFVESEGAYTSTGQFQDKVVVMPGDIMDSGRVSPHHRTKPSRWEHELATSRVYENDGRYQCEAPKKDYDPCAMTQAICAQTGKPDDCQELTRLRAFRDQVLATTAVGRQAIDDYYRDTAAITQSLLSHPESQTWLRVLREEHLIPMGDAFAAGRYQETTDRFEQFMSLLREHHLHA